MKIKVTTQNPGVIASELLAVFAVDAATSTGRDAVAAPRLLSESPELAEAVRPAFASGEFRAGLAETLLLHAPAGLGTKRLLVVGLGAEAKATAHEVRKGAGTAVRFLKPRGIRSLAIALPALGDVGASARALAEGALLGDFDPDVYRSDRRDQSVHELEVLAGQSGREAAAAGVAEGTAIGEAQNLTRTLVNEPGNRMTPTILGRRAAEMCREAGLGCEVYSTDKLRELGMGAFLAVAQGSAEPPALIVMTYEPADAPKDGPVLGLVGKGISFDTGGISIKPADGMEKMKYDMAGGAAMIGAMRAIAALRPRVKVIGIVCSAENMPSGTAYKPGDVVTAMSGKTIDVVNTDAEGRLVLADGLTYARRLGCTHLIDAATLTGACVVALGMVNAGVFANDEAAYQKFAQGLAASGERFWRLPLEDEYREQIKSPIADIMNTGGRWGGAVTAAMFLKEFAESTPWLHLDIAGMAWIEDQRAWIAKGPSGVAVRSILEWVRSYSA